MYIHNHLLYKIQHKFLKELPMEFGILHDQNGKELKSILV